MYLNCYFWYLDLDLAQLLAGSLGSGRSVDCGSVATFPFRNNRQRDSHWAQLKIEDSTKTINLFVMAVLRRGTVELWRAAQFSDDERFPNFMMLSSLMIICDF
ncbi:hypothetical protein PoB_001546700 [Plakobranchus ocellatus]|uniref:Uncharacterized protein n=1 Tax=Plakobranchus ocellatus TaxID=259542 RepID=A0AAV3Z340_9GAST|nr:hypothetical protein PoB_001546700 [Plakobranchus ocellatus]